MRSIVNDLAVMAPTTLPQRSGDVLAGIIAGLAALHDEVRTKLATIPTILYYLCIFLMIELDSRKLRTKAVVIDTLRFTTTACQALRAPYCTAQPKA